MEERNKPTEEQKEKWLADPKNWKLYFFIIIRKTRGYYLPSGFQLWVGP